MFIMKTYQRIITLPMSHHHIFYDSSCNSCICLINRAYNHIIHLTFHVKFSITTILNATTKSFFPALICASKTQQFQSLLFSIPKYHEPQAAHKYTLCQSKPVLQKAKPSRGATQNPYYPRSLKIESNFLYTVIKIIIHFSFI